MPVEEHRLPGIHWSECRADDEPAHIAGLWLQGRVFVPSTYLYVLPQGLHIANGGTVQGNVEQWECLIH